MTEQHTHNDNKPNPGTYEETRGNMIYTYQDYSCSICGEYMSRQQVGSRPVVDD